MVDLEFHEFESTRFEDLADPAPVDLQILTGQVDCGIRSLEQCDAKFVGVEARPILDAIERRLGMNDRGNPLRNVVTTRIGDRIEIRRYAGSGGLKPGETGAMQLGKA